jgi:trimeric autotransporter adhesin
MKKVIIPAIFLLLAFSSYPQGTSINTSGADPDNSSMLDVNSTTKGVLIPRVSLTGTQDATSITSPAVSLLVYNTATTGTFPNNVFAGYYYNSGTSIAPAWTRLVTANGGTQGNAWATLGNAGTDGTNFIGTIDNRQLNFKVNNQKAGRIDHLLHNTFFGYQAGNSNQEGLNNTVNGYQALYSNTSGGNNTAIGHLALYSNIAGDSATAIGGSAMYYANSTSSHFTNLNVALGFEALRGSTTASANTGNWNNAIGFQTLWNNISGNYNTADGCQGLYHNTTGDGNLAIGYQTLYFNTTGFHNTAVGQGALYSNSTGYDNTAIGYNAGFPDGDTLYNTTCIGANTGSSIIAHNRIEIGDASVYWIGGQVNWSIYSDERIKDNIKEDVQGLAFINLLRPVTYNLNIHQENEIIYKNKKNNGKDSPSKYDIEKVRMTGFIAQEVSAAAIKVGYDFSGVHIPSSLKDLYSLTYADFVVPLVKAVQELSEKNSAQAISIETLRTQIEKQQKEIDDLKVLIKTK